MIAVIFEVWPTEGRSIEYFDLAAFLREDLSKIDGFLSIERFESLTTKGKYLSLRSRSGVMKKLSVPGETLKGIKKLRQWAAAAYLPIIDCE